MATAPDDPRRVAIFIHDLFHLFGFNAMFCNVLDVVFVPLGVPFPKLHGATISRRTDQRCFNYYLKAI